MKGIKRKSTDITDSPSTSTKNLSLLSNNTYCHECNILFSKADNFIQHKLNYCQKNSSLCNVKPKSISNSRPVQIGQIIYVPIPVMPSKFDSAKHDHNPLDLSKQKKLTDGYGRLFVSSNLPLDLSSENTKRIPQQQQLYQCEYCSVCFHSSETLHAHQDNYCIEYQKYKKKDYNNISMDIGDNHR